MIGSAGVSLRLAASARTTVGIRVAPHAVDHAPEVFCRVVAGLIGLVALVASWPWATLGFLRAAACRANAPTARGDAAAPLQATEAVPLSQERIEGPPPPPELTDEEKAEQAAEKKAKADQAAKAAAADEAAEAPATVITPPPPADKAGDTADKSAPPLEEPPH